MSNNYDPHAKDAWHGLLICLVIISVAIALVVLSHAADAATTRWVADERGGDRVVVFRSCSQEDDFGRIRLARYGYLAGPDGNRIVLTCTESMP
jgi:hypothetical protein